MKYTVDFLETDPSTGRRREAREEFSELKNALDFARNINDSVAWVYDCEIREYTYRAQRGFVRRIWGTDE